MLRNGWIALMVGAALGVVGCHGQQQGQANRSVSPTTAPVQVTETETTQPTTEPAATVEVPMPAPVEQTATAPVTVESTAEALAPVVATQPDLAAAAQAAPAPHREATAETEKPRGNAAGIVEKPFIALPKFGFGDKPSVLLLTHARGDSPVPLSEYAKQKTYSLEAFDLRRNLSLLQLEHRLGPPAQWADYSDLWVVYRLNMGKELWLHFTGPEKDRLQAADVVAAVEDGYSRERVFPAHTSW